MLPVRYLSPQPNAVTSKKTRIEYEGSSAVEHSLGININNSNTPLSSHFNVVSPESREKMESCILNVGHQVQNSSEEMQSSKFANRAFQPVASSMPQQQHQHHQQRYYSSQRIQPTDNSRMSPSSEFLTVDSNSKREVTELLVPQVSDSFNLNFQRQQSFRGEVAQSNMACHPDMNYRGVRPRTSYHYQPVSHTPRQEWVHDDNRGAFDCQGPPDHTDREVENILANDSHNNPCHNHNTWQYQQYYQSQSQPQHPQQHQHQQFHREHYYPPVPSQQVRSPYYYQNYQYHDYHGPTQHHHQQQQHDMYMQYQQSPYHFMPASHAQPYQYNRKRKFTEATPSPQRPDYFIHVDRSSSPMSDITASPVSSFDEYDDQNDLMQEETRNVTTSQQLHQYDTPSTPLWKELTVDTDINDSTLIKEPRIEREERRKRCVSEFDWDDNVIILRTVSPIKSKLMKDTTQLPTPIARETNPNRTATKNSTLDTKIWRSKNDGPNLIITNNISQTSSEQDEDHYITN